MSAALMAEIMVRLEQALVENAPAFVVVAVAVDSGDVVHATGPFTEAEAALVQAGQDDATWKQHADPGEGNLKHVVVALWEPST